MLGENRLPGIFHTPRAKPKPVKRGPKIAPREVVMAAAQAFARNEIDRAELMRRITPGELVEMLHAAYEAGKTIVEQTSESLHMGENDQ